MHYFFIYLAGAAAVIDWIAVAKQWKRLEYFAKPGVMLALFAWLWQVGGLEGGLQGGLLWFAAGILFSLAGDVFLMLRRERFIAGLVSFLLAHIAYIIGLNTAIPPAGVVSLGLPVLAVMLFGMVVSPILTGLKTSGKHGLKFPIILYAAVITLMLLSALLNLVRTEAGLGAAAGSWTVEAAVLVSLGALLFFISDATLAYNKFVTPLRLGKLRVITTYHLGQILIILGAAANFLP